MITAFSLFGRKDITDRERRMIRCAQKAAQTLFDNRFNEGIKDHWDVDVNDLTLEDVELNVIEAIQGKYYIGGNLKDG